MRIVLIYGSIEPNITSKCQSYMNKTFNFKFVLMALVIMLGIVISMPSNTSAGYDYGYYSNGYSSYSRYGYDTNYYSPTPMVRPTYTQPVYVSQPVYVPQPVIVQQPVVVQPTVVYNQANLVSSCSAKVSYNNSSGVANVVWSANPSGGNGYYSYSWTGTDGLNSSHKDAYYNYSTTGTKHASVNITSGGHTITVNCNPVSITYPYPVNYETVYAGSYTRPIYVNKYQNLDVGCFVDPTNAKVDQPVTWTAEVTNAVGPITYSWTGSEGLTGSQSSVIKYYGTPGSKSAIVTVTSADGRTATKACSNAITISTTKIVKAPVKSTVAYTSAKTEAKPVAVVQTPKPVVDLASSDTAQNTNQSAVSLLSLNNVPWGWVAVIIILILFFTVMYLLFNNKKI